jgi:hypothetical protein
MVGNVLGHELNYFVKHEIKDKKVLQRKCSHRMFDRSKGKNRQGEGSVCSHGDEDDLLKDVSSEPDKYVTSINLNLTNTLLVSSLMYIYIIYLSPLI